MKLGVGVKIKPSSAQKGCPFPSVAGFFPDGKLAIGFLHCCSVLVGREICKKRIDPPTLVQQLGIVFALKCVKFSSTNA